MASDVLLTFRRTRCVGWKNGIASVLELLQVSGSQRTLLSVSLEWEHREILNGLYQGTMLFALLKRNTQDTLSPQGNVGLLQAPPAGCWGRGECGFKSTGSCLPVIDPGVGFCLLQEAFWMSLSALLALRLTPQAPPHLVPNPVKWDSL